MRVGLHFGREGRRLQRVVGRGAVALRLARPGWFRVGVVFARGRLRRSHRRVSKDVRNGGGGRVGNFLLRLREVGI